ncbi:hypothetical protein POM88_028669 [Heracleum sosnowskyi]|uniref:F-box domain-containing protein n=1 Tax=Heracleum sosnowskyi TaxID=360622 RepID=A0AAD8HTB2_9APIA|nr:hypothetical protein POM88_028669 [Heracleum sosnowskyi]
MESKREAKEAIITYVHESIIIKILCFLPAETVIRCRSVCKNWDILISSACFAEAYSSSGTALPQFLLTLHRTMVLAHLVDASCDSDFPPYNCPGLVTKSILPYIFCSKSSLCVSICSVCSFTGFIVAYDRGAQYVGSPHEPYHRLNPITRQHILVQQDNKNWHWTGCALLLAHKTSQLKLLKFTGIREARIQTIGTGLWRTVTKDSSTSHVQFTGFPIFLNGIYHWGSSRLVKVCFNPEE